MPPPPPSLVTPPPPSTNLTSTPLPHPPPPPLYPSLSKDIVLGWYNTLTALGYHPFLDRLSLDSVENIPDHIEETATIVIALTRNLFDSYWCAAPAMTRRRFWARTSLLWLYSY